MKRHRAPYIPQRRQIYIGCEGASEASYAQLLQDLVREADLAIHLKVDELGPGAGDPLARIDMAVRRLKRLQNTRIAPTQRFALLDHDQAEADPERAERARRLAADHGIVIVWQRTCFEAVLLRHLPGRATAKPPTTPEASKALLKAWPEYRKPMPRQALATRIDREAIARAVLVEPGLAMLVQALGL